MPDGLTANQRDRERRRILGILDASRPYLESATPWDIAIELIVQGLDVIPQELWPLVLADVQRSIRDDAEPSGHMHSD